MTEMGEYLVGAYLKVIDGCDFVDYNVHFPGGGLEGLKELDVMGFNLLKKVAYLCEVTTHIEGLLYDSSYDETVSKIARKFESQKQYAAKYLSDFPNQRFMFWSPVVSRQKIITRLQMLAGLELIVNEEYTKRGDSLREQARKMSSTVTN